MSEPPSSSASSWYESLFGKNEIQDVIRNRSNCLSNTTLSSRGDSWTKFRQFFNFSGLISSENTVESLKNLRYVNHKMTFSIYLLYK
jgi:hypothetical protein